MTRTFDTDLARKAAHSADPVDLTRAMVAVPSVNPSLSGGGTGEEAVTRLCRDWLIEWGLEVEWIESDPGRPSLVARIGEGRPRTILNGHTDTVGVEGMRIDPFDPVLRDGRLLGRGSCDMKAGLGAILAAARRLAADPQAWPGELIVALTADEEHTSIGLRELLDGGIEADRAIVTEPTSLAISPANKGFFWAKVHVEGRAAHGSRPDLGVDAIRGAGLILAALDTYNVELTFTDPHPLLGQGSIHAGTIRGGTTPSVYPADCHMILEARTLPGEDPGEVLNRLERVVAQARTKDPRLRARIEGDLYRAGAEVATDSDLVRELSAACEADGLAPRLEGMTAWVESAWFVEAGIPAVCFGPGSIELAHTDAESVPVEEIRQAARILERVVRAGGDGEADVDPEPEAAR
jgi:acetylornithine deacetylase